VRTALLQGILFLLTIASTYYVGGAAYCVALMSILVAHEMGHYVVSRRHGVPATLPYFLPFPLSPFGTFGAIIKMKGVITDKNALFDIGIAGPLSGFLVSLPFIVAGIKMSTVQQITGQTSFIQLGDPLIFKILQWVVIGDLPEGYDVVLHPVGYAGWVGLFVTALNLLPVGQLDGGHLVFAVFGKKSRWVYGATIVLMGMLAVFYNPGWIMLVVLLLIFGMHHPEPIDTETPLDEKRKLLAWIALFIFLLSFTPAPFPSFNLGGSNGGIAI
jgi:membrane-associated protease RseP (regulator of RpoE activity)